MWKLKTKSLIIEPELFYFMNNWDKKGVAMLTACTGKESKEVRPLRGVFTLAHLWIAHLACKSLGLKARSVYIVDCAIRFNVFAISDEILRRGASPEPVLQRIKVRRDFTPYQLLSTVQDILQKPELPYIYFFLSPCKQFFDNDVEPEEARFLLEQLLKGLHRMNQKSIPAVIVEKPSYRHPLFREIFPKMCELSHPLWKTFINEKEQSLRGNEGLSLGIRTEARKALASTYSGSRLSGSRGVKARVLITG